jgi:hypothetical protein
MFWFDPTNQTYNGSVVGLGFDGGNLSSNALRLFACNGCEFRDILCQNFIGGYWVISFENTYQYPAGMNHFDRVAINASANNCNGLYCNNITGNVFERCLFQGGANSTAVRIDGASDTNLFLSCEASTSSSGVALTIQNAGFNNNWINGIINAQGGGAGTAIYADNNGGYNHLWGVYLGYSDNETVLYDPNATGKIWFHSCIGPPSVSGSNNNGNTGDYTQLAIPSGQSRPIPIVNGLLIVADSWSHYTALFMVSGTNAILESQTGNVWAVGVNVSGALSLGWDGSTWRLYNNVGANHYIRISMMQTHASNFQQGF